MPDFVFAPPQIIFVPIEGGGDFPVRRVFCVGRNYAEHAQEMGHSGKEPPFFFTKPADALVTSGTDTPYPLATKDLHHEIELVAAIGTAGAQIAEADALNHVWGYAAGIDLTRRDIQAEAKKQSRPWDMAKGFDHSAPIGNIVPVAKSGHPASTRIWLDVSGTIRQDGNTSGMLWPVAGVIAQLSALVELKPGDLIFTGTPSGVGPVVRGDTLRGEVEGVGIVETRVV